MSQPRALVFILFLFASLSAFPQDARSAYQDGLRAQATEDYALAVEKFKEALTDNPSYGEPMVGLAQAFLAMAEYDEAYKYVAMALVGDRNNPDLAVLEGRIKIGQGDTTGARSLFNSVLADQPNNAEARMGLAEADIADGRLRTALSGYAQIVKLAPESTPAILSLAQLSDELGDQASTARYYDLALKSHSSDPRVQLAAARWFERTGDFPTAEKHAQIALSLAPSMDQARTLLGQIYLQTGRASDAVTVLRDVAGHNRDDNVAWYSLGLAYRGVKDTGQALSSFASGLVARPEDELTRLASENTALDALAMDDQQRKAMAAYHLTQGQAQESRNYLDRAVAEYRRALLLDPTSQNARVAYARIFRTQGFPDKYLSELKVLAKLGTPPTSVQDDIDGLTSSLADTISRAFGYDQYNLDRTRYVIPVFTIPAKNRLLHPMADEDVGRYFAFLLGGNDAITVPSGSTIVTGFDDAFRRARSGQSDYFIVLQIDEVERSFSAVADLYLSRTAALIGSFSSFRTGNDRVRDAFLKLGSQVAATLPLRGTLLVRKFDQGLIDLGTFQGLKKGDSMVIVRKGRVQMNPDTPGLSFASGDALGDFLVTGVDEGVSEGSVKIRGYFDYINPGDQVVFAPKPAPRPQVQPAQRSGNIITRLLGIGG
ncbi:MAG TPA: tetratricopeptide repeat protein [Spirochaetia bacterium]|nr:tetratricopeptide repeat protein [Spirochaetia bacterium]